MRHIKMLVPRPIVGMDPWYDGFTIGLWETFKALWRGARPAPMSVRDWKRNTFHPSRLEWVRTGETIREAICRLDLPPA